MIQLQNVSKVYATGNAALSEITVDIEKGEFVFLVGQTGSGKTTLLRLLVREMLPTSGAILIDDLDIVKIPSKKIPDLRKKIGFVFQDLKLLVDKTILENISLPLEVAGVKSDQAIRRAEELLEQVGVLEHKEKFPIQLSGGELQRAAIARALALSPDILLADEPTGNLDEKTAFEIVDLLNNINEQGTTIIMATHNMDIVERLKNRILALEKGKLMLDKAGTKKPKKPDVQVEDVKEEEGKVSDENIGKVEEVKETEEAPKETEKEEKKEDKKEEKEKKKEEEKKAKKEDKKEEKKEEHE